MTCFEKEIFCRPAYDRRHSDPSKNYGTHGVDMFWILRGPVGAIEFAVSTNWHLPAVTREFVKKFIDPFHFMPMPSHVTYHSPYPIAEIPESRSESCDYIGGRACFSGSSVCEAHDIFQILLEQGSEGVWQDMERRYYSIFGTDEEQQKNEILFRKFD